MPIRPSTMRTYLLPVAGPPKSKAIRVAAAECDPVRVLVRAVGGNAFLSLDPATLNQTIAGEAAGEFWIEPGGNSDAIVLTRGQVLFAMASSAGTALSVAISDAFPVERENLRALAFAVQGRP